MCWYSYLYHVSSAVYAASLLDTIRLIVIVFTQVTRHDTNSCTNTICIIAIYRDVFLNTWQKKINLAFHQLHQFDQISSAWKFSFPGKIKILLYFAIIGIYVSILFQFILSLNSVCNGIKLYLHEVPDIDVVVSNVELTQIFWNQN